MLALLLVGWYEGLYRSEAAHTASLRTQQQAAAASVLALDARYAVLVSSEKQLPSERRSLAALERALPNGPDLDDLVTTLYAAAKRAGVNLSSIGSPPPPGFGQLPTAPASSAAAGPSQLSLSLSITGTASQIEDLVNILDAEPRLFVVDNFSLDFGSGAPTGPASSSAATELTGTTLMVRAFYASASSDSAAS